MSGMGSDPIADTSLLEQLARDVLERSCETEVVASSESAWPEELWRALDTTGLTRVGVSEARGGAGGGWAEAAAVLRTAARYAAPVPLAETSVLAGWALDEAAVELPGGPLTIARGDLRVERRRDGWILSGRADRVPWARESSWIVMFVDRRDTCLVAAVPSDRPRIVRSLNLAREPRDTVICDEIDLRDLPVAELESPTGLVSRGALVRAIQMSGALDRVLELTVEYASVRRQFGRAIAEFQAVQQELALLAGEAAAARAAADEAVSAVAAVTGTPSTRAAHTRREEVAAAKVRTGIAAYEGARIAHQLHGAIGITFEHQLHHFTSRLLSWREEYGNERRWATELGRLLAAMGGEGTWRRLVTAGDPVAP